jgi:ATP-binding cassette subfamily F protein uup
MDRMVDHLFAFEGEGVIKDFPGNYTQYRQALANEQFTGHKVAENKIEEPVIKQRLAPTDQKKLTFKEKLEFENIEKEIPVLQKEKATLEEKMNTGNMGFYELQKAAQRIGEIVQLLDEKEMKWLELSERI